MQEQRQQNGVGPNFRREQQPIHSRAFRNDALNNKNNDNHMCNAYDRPKEIDSQQKKNSEDNACRDNGSIVQTETDLPHQRTIAAAAGDCPDPYQRDTGGDAPPEHVQIDCCQTFPSQRGAEVSGPCPSGSGQSLEAEVMIENHSSRKPNHFLCHGRANKIKGRNSL